MYSKTIGEKTSSLQGVSMYLLFKYTFKLPGIVNHPMPFQSVLKADIVVARSKPEAFKVIISIALRIPTAHDFHVISACVYKT